MADAVIDQWVKDIKDAFNASNPAKAAAILAEAQSNSRMNDLKMRYGANQLLNDIYNKTDENALKSALYPYYSIKDDWTTAAENTSTNQIPSWVDRIYKAFNISTLIFLDRTDEEEVYKVLDEAKSGSLMFALTKSYNYWYQRTELSLENELYDEMSGKELRKALTIYYEALENESGATPKNPFIPVDVTVTHGSAAAPAAVLKAVGQSTPLLRAPLRPGSTEQVTIDNLFVYLMEFDDASNHRLCLERYVLRSGKLCSPATPNSQVPQNANRRVWLYFTHRTDDLTVTPWEGHFKDSRGTDKTGFPAIGPLNVPPEASPGVDPEWIIDIWQQNDWCIFENRFIEGYRADEVLMADWRGRYKIGDYIDPPACTKFYTFSHFSKKDEQETWSGKKPLPALAEFGIDKSIQLLIGTTSHMPEPECKLLLVHKNKEGHSVNAGSFNKIAQSDHDHAGNRVFTSNHTYNEDLVKRLMQITGKPSNSEFDRAGFTPPKSAFLLPGDICWQNQGQTLLCGTYSFSMAMNYWSPFKYNPLEIDGRAMFANCEVPILWISSEVSTPDQIVKAAEMHDMFAKVQSGENLSRDRFFMLVKLWLSAGVPVITLVNEKPVNNVGSNLWPGVNAAGGHFKVLIGYDSLLFFINNSGMDQEYEKSKRTPGIQDSSYEFAPVGNDVDSEVGLYEKWRAYSNLTDALSSANECTIIPVYPKDSVFAGKESR
jgi:hypothetical protein